MKIWPVRKRVAGVVLGLVVVAVAAAVVVWWPGPPESVADRPEGGRTADVELPAESPALPPQLDLSAANRGAAVPGLPDWSRAGYREGAGLPGADDVTGDPECVVTAAELAGGYDPRTGTRLVFQPDGNTRYDTVSDGDWDEDGMSYERGKGGWLWPGRGLFRVQSRAVHEDYADDHESAPANRKDLFEGSVNVHWKSGIALADRGSGFAARAGDRTIELAKRPKGIETGGYVNVRAANTMRFYAAQEALWGKE